MKYEHPTHEVVSKAPHIRFPAVVAPGDSQLMAMLYQLDRTQWMTPQELADRQFAQLHEVLVHASRTCPYYERVLREAGWSPGDALTPDSWRDIPLLHRAVAQSENANLISRNPPTAHGRPTESRTSGSTGTPVRYLTTAPTQMMWNAITVRFHLWQRQDFSKKLCAIRAGQGPVVKGAKHANSWGAPISRLFASGPAALLDCRNDIAELVSGVAAEEPVYLLGLPTTIDEMARHCLEKGMTLPGLRQVCTYAETLRPETRAVIREAWGAGVADMYSAQEMGYLALQCPDSEGYHVQSENVLLEVLDDEDRPCGPGQTGRVVITALHNFAMPLIRYELSDIVEVGGPCSCGRGLPVIRGIRGRLRNLATLPDGRRIWPPFYAADWSHLVPARQIQIVQKTVQQMEVRLVMDRDVTEEEKRRFAAKMREAMGYDFDFTFRCQRERIVHPNGKLEAFVSEVTPWSHTRTPQPTT